MTIGDQRGRVRLTSPPKADEELEKQVSCPQRGASTGGRPPRAVASAGGIKLKGAGVITCDDALTRTSPRPPAAPASGETLPARSARHHRIPHDTGLDPPPRRPAGALTGDQPDSVSNSIARKSAFGSQENPQVSAMPRHESQMGRQDVPWQQQSHRYFGTVRCATDSDCSSSRAYVTTILTECVYFTESLRY